MKTTSNADLVPITLRIEPDVSDALAKKASYEGQEVADYAADILIKHFLPEVQKTSIALHDRLQAEIDVKTWAISKAREIGKRVVDPNVTLKVFQALKADEYLRSLYLRAIGDREEPGNPVKARVNRSLGAAIKTALRATAAKTEGNPLKVQVSGEFIFTYTQLEYDKLEEPKLELALLDPSVPRLPTLDCPVCCHQMVREECIEKIPTATRFEDCLRRCEPCGIGASNASKDVTYIFRDPLKNIPVQSREGAIGALSRAISVLNRGTKRRRFGFSTSEDAVTWVVFTHLLRSGHLFSALTSSGVITSQALTTAPTLLLWGVPIEGGDRGADIQKELIDLCHRFERPDRYSEPDVIVDLGEGGIVLIEVKYRSGNDLQPADYYNWSRYASAPQLNWKFEDVKASGCYELARNWFLLKSLAGRRPATLVNLGSADLFRGKEGARLDRFVDALDLDERTRFIRLTWSDLLRTDLDSMPDWFVRFCRDRQLIQIKLV
jgi:hypothetical protein